MSKNNYHLFSANMKMADIVLQNYTLLSVLPRFGIQLGFGEKTLAELCAKHNVDQNFFLLVCNVYTNDDYLPSKKDILKLNVEELIEYLKMSHKYYLEEKITSIEQKLEDKNEYCVEKHHQIIHKFFVEYKQEIVNHFNYEDQIVFPYINKLVKGQTNVNYHINQYEKNHSNIEDKLSDLKNIVIKYLPDNAATGLRNSVLFDIFLFEEDLIKHSRIENKILIPFVSQIEKNIEKNNE